MGTLQALEAAVKDLRLKQVYVRVLGVLSLLLHFSFSLPRLFAEENPPLKIEGPGGFLFILVTDGDDKAEVNSNSEVLYEGKKVLAGQPLQVSYSYPKLKEKFDRELWQSLPQTPWLSNGIELHIPPIWIEDYLKSTFADRQKFQNSLRNMSRTKAQVLTSILFDSSITLDRSTLDALQRNSSNPSPGPIKVNFPVTRRAGGEEFPWIFRWSTEGFVEIALDQIRFEFENKRLEFDPRLGSSGGFRFKLRCKETEIKGETKQVWRPKVAYRYYHDWPFFEKFNYLESGIVSDVDFEITMSFVPNETGDYWNFRIGDGTTLKSFVRDPSSEDSREKIEVVMRYRDPEPTEKFDPETGERVYSRDQILKIPATSLDRIAEVLTRTFERALSASMASEELVPLIPFKHLWRREDPASAWTQLRLEKFQVLNDGLHLRLGLRSFVGQRANCIESIPKNFEMNPLPADWSAISNSSAPKTWAFTSSGGGWNAEVSDPFPQNLGVTISEPALNVLARAAWASGAFCASTEAWTTRPHWIPHAELYYQQFPYFRFSDSKISSDLNFSLQFFERNFDEINERFQRGHHWDVKLPVSVSLNATDKTLFVDGLRELNVTSVSVETQQWLRDLLVKLWEDQSQFFVWTDLEWKNFLRDQQRASPEASESSPLFEIKKVDLSKGFLRAEVGSTILPPAEPEPLPPPIPETRFVSANQQTIKVMEAEFEWTSDVENALYSWRIRSVEDEVWSRWSDFSPVKNEVFSFRRSGRYQLQVKAMNVHFQIEREPALLEWSVIESPSPSRTFEEKKASRQDLLPDPDVKEEASKKSEAQAQREPSKSIFGCSLNFERPETDRSILLYLILICLLVTTLFSIRGSRLN